MKKNLFLLGNIGTGKSTLIKNALVPYLEFVGGFFVQRVVVNDIYAAFRLLPVTTAEEYILDLRQERLNNTKNAFLFRDESGNWKNSMDVFSTTGIDCLENAILQNKKIILMDETGGIELRSTAFMNALRKAVLSSLPVLGVIKTPDNARTLEECRAGEGVASVNSVFLKEMEENPANELLFVDRDNRDQAVLRVKEFVNAAIE